MKKTFYVPIESFDIKTGQTNDSTKTVPQSVSKQTPRAQSMTVSAAYNQAIGPLVFS
jgi:hypothetical protein